MLKIVIVLAVIFFIITAFSIFLETKREVIFILFIVTTILFMVSFELIGQRFGSINTLKGKSPYEMVIKYELKDSTYIPVDTVFIRKYK